MFPSVYINNNNFIYEQDSIICTETNVWTMIHNIAKMLNNKPPKKCFKKCIKFSYVSISKTFIDKKKMGN